MKAVLLFLVIVGSVFGQDSDSVPNSASDESSSEKLKVGVYYETLCPDSKRFIKTQLHSTKKSTLGEYFDVEFVPYGKATTTPTTDSYIFSCQHGEKECEGNKMHACAVKYINSTEQLLDFIHCSMSKSYPPGALNECADKFNIPTEEISACAQGYEGSELLAKNGEKTQSLRPKLFFVPTITYNGVYNAKNLEASQNDFKTVLCQEMKKNGHSCNNGGLTIKSTFLLVLLLFVVFQFHKILINS